MAGSMYPVSGIIPLRSLISSEILMYCVNRERFGYVCYVLKKSHKSEDENDLIS